jgi:ATP-dependent exoDNAse (exonuclease V) beta subunit
MLESKMEATPEMQRRINDGFKQWMGSSLLSSDDEEEATDDYIEHDAPSPTALGQQRQQEHDLET